MFDLEGERVVHGKYGFPSNHTQAIAYIAAYCVLFTWFRLVNADNVFYCSGPPLIATYARSWRQPKSSSPLEALYRVFASIAATAGALAVGFGRVYLGYHTTDQVADITGVLLLASVCHRFLCGSTGRLLVGWWLVLSWLWSGST